jgi:SAM-dependent MidA family methyltransferase
MTPFAQFMEDALYGSDGYYSTGRAQTGMRGDYFTAPETGAMFGQLLKTIFQEWQKRLGLHEFHIVEVGAGISLSSKGEGWGEATTHHVVERSPARRKKIKELNLPIQIHQDISEIKNESVNGIMFANELIDAFPVHRVHMKNGKLEEAFVHGGFIEWLSPSTPRLAAYFDRLKITLPEGYETEINLAMHEWVHGAAAVLSKGFIVLIDYGRPAWDYYAEERSGGTLRGFKNHRVLGIPELLVEGSQADWTADVDFTSLALDAKEAGLTPLAFMEMGTFLKQGVKGGGWRVESNGLKYLLHPDGLGTQFHVLILGKNINPAEWIFEHNRIARLGLST